MKYTLNKSVVYISLRHNLNFRAMVFDGFLLEYFRNQTDIILIPIYVFYIPKIEELR